jgi:hypothetical protein
MIAIGIMMAIAGYNLPDPMPMGLWWVVIHDFYLARRCLG